jgi:hypothetical protein
MQDSEREEQAAVARMIERTSRAGQIYRLEAQRTRWRRRGRWLLQIVIVPLVLTAAAFWVRDLSPAHPPDIGSGHLWSTLFALAFACLVGGVWGGMVALGAIFAIFAVKLHDHPLSDLAAWAWWGFLLTAYASLLVMLYFRAPEAGPPFLPRRRSGLLRMREAFRNRWAARRAGAPPTHRRYRREAAPDFHVSEPRRAAVRLYAQH